MKPIGPLMREHRLIERMVALMDKELARIGKENDVNPDFIGAAVDFFRSYADRTHHGKEEDILFRELAKKQLSKEHRKVMDELIAEHVSGRKTVASLSSARANYTRGNAGALGDIKACLQELVRFYPTHIEKEDKHFFYPSMEYFSRQEQDDMLEEFREFDRKLVHEKYQGIVKELEKKV